MGGAIVRQREGVAHSRTSSLACWWNPHLTTSLRHAMHLVAVMWANLCGILNHHLATGGTLLVVEPMLVVVARFNHPQGPTCTTEDRLSQGEPGRQRQPSAPPSPPQPQGVPQSACLSCSTGGTNLVGGGGRRQADAAFEALPESASFSRAGQGGVSGRGPERA